MKSLNSMKVFVVGTLSIGLFSSTALIPATAQELPRVFDASMPRDQQITLAESAAPAEVSSKATVYVLGPKGYEKAREGTNGFSCFVGRHFVKPAETTIEPQCFDAEGSRTLLLVYMHGEELRTGQRQVRGRNPRQTSPTDIRRAVTSIRAKPGFLYTDVRVRKSPLERDPRARHWHFPSALDVLCAEHDNERHRVRRRTEPRLSWDDSPRSRR